MSTPPLSKFSPKTHILIKGARVHNLKNIDVAIQRGKLVVITGLSGSGKSSLAFSTLYAEGQRRYVESLSSYARQFLGKVEKPEVDYIKGISPAIAIEQKVNSTNSRSTVGTMTEIYDYIKLLYARIGKTYHPTTGNLIQKHSAEDVVDYILSQKEKTRVYLVAPVVLKKGEKTEDQLQLLIQQGFSRAYVKNEVVWIEDLIKEKAKVKKEIEIIVDRYIISSESQEIKGRIGDSAETSFYEGKHNCIVYTEEDGKIYKKIFSDSFEEAGMEFEEPTVHLFSFNNPIGACPTCEGYGKVIGIDEDLVIPNKSLSLYQDAIACWKGPKMGRWKNKIIQNAEILNFPIHRPIKDLTEEEYNLLWTGNQYFKGLNTFFNHLERKKYKIHYRVMLARYRGRTKCPDCKGNRLRKEADYVKINQHSISQLVNLPLKELAVFFKKIKLDAFQQKVAKRLLIEINTRIQYLLDVGVGYLNLNRSANTLSGGETQRINLATSVGSSLVGSMYILDEPSIGLHPKDTENLIRILKGLQKLGNTVIVVEHDEDIIRAADEIIDLGPEAGSQGGNLIFNGSLQELLKEHTLTAQYLNGQLKLEKNNKTQRKLNNKIHLSGARENNLQNINVDFPLHALTVVTGVSGSGKSSLVKQILYPALQKKLGGYGEKVGKFDEISGAIQQIDEIEFIDQNPIGRSSRSNPVTYIKAYDEIRKLYSKRGLARARAYKPSHFSFNVDGGRCEICRGEGEIIEEMQFMADIHLKCEACDGKRFKEEILEVKFKGKNIADLLEMTVQDAVDFFNENPEDKDAQRIVDKLSPLLAVGLGYIKLGQSSSTLSGGEAQRIKLASYLGKGEKKQSILFIFDEPTTGLHFHDIKKLLASFDALIEKGHSIIVIEHNPAIINFADWVIDLGPKGGDEGGLVVFQGRVEELKKCKTSFTAQYL